MNFKLQHLNSCYFKVHVDNPSQFKKLQTILETDFKSIDFKTKETFYIFSSHDITTIYYGFFEYFIHTLKNKYNITCEIDKNCNDYLYGNNLELDRSWEEFFSKEERKVNNKTQWEYIKEMVKRNSSLICCYTGFGKTDIQSFLIHSFLKKNPNDKISLLLPSSTIIEDFIERMLTKFKFKYEIDYRNPSEKTQILIMNPNVILKNNINKSYQHKCLEHFRKSKMIVMDESHSISSSSYSTLLLENNHYKYLFGFTATPDKFRSETFGLSTKYSFCNTDFNVLLKYTGLPKINLKYNKDVYLYVLKGHFSIISKEIRQRAYATSKFNKFYLQRESINQTFKSHLLLDKLINFLIKKENRNLYIPVPSRKIGIDILEYFNKKLKSHNQEMLGFFWSAKENFISDKNLVNKKTYNYWNDKQIDSPTINSIININKDKFRFLISTSKSFIGFDCPHINTIFSGGFANQKNLVQTCFTENTKIKTTKGDFTIKELVKKIKTEYLYTYCKLKRGEIVPTKINDIFPTIKTNTIYKIYIDGKTDPIEYTANHKIMLRNGEYKQVKDLKINDRLMPCHPDRLKFYNLHDIFFNYEKKVKNFITDSNCIIKITNIINNKSYIDEVKYGLENRFKQLYKVIYHQEDSQENSTQGDDSHFHSAIRKYGVKNFYINILWSETHDETESNRNANLIKLLKIKYRSCTYGYNENIKFISTAQNKYKKKNHTNTVKKINAKISNIEKIHYEKPVQMWNLEVKNKNHNYPVSNGYFHSNSGRTFRSINPLIIIPLELPPTNPDEHNKISANTSLGKIKKIQESYDNIKVFNL